MERRKVEFKEDVRGYLEASFADEAQVMKNRNQNMFIFTDRHDRDGQLCYSVKVVRNQNTHLRLCASISICLFSFSVLI